ncbi:uncharacterized protein RJT20DRAFT_819 [Scheffersomyces xylosifermentans]|uniref:uncharacterized protein n=1 Tax=Scheffersomyces xylosifermentans TaxID=1304137 RepID=UPI00315D5BC5
MASRQQQPMPPTPPVYAAHRTQLPAFKQQYADPRMPSLGPNSYEIMSSPSRKNQSQFKVGGNIAFGERPLSGPSSQALLSGFTGTNRVMNLQELEQSLLPPDQYWNLPYMFDPKRESNMSSEEKIHKWMSNIPCSYNTNINSITTGCFPATLSYTSSRSASLHELDEDDEIMELQARKVTRFATRLYMNDSEPIARVELDEYEDDYYDNDGNLMNFNVQNMQDMDHSLDNYMFRTRDTDYLVQTSF